MKTQSCGQAMVHDGHTWHGTEKDSSGRPQVKTYWCPGVRSYEPPRPRRMPLGGSTTARMRRVPELPGASCPGGGMCEKPTPTGGGGRHSTAATPTARTWLGDSVTPPG